MRSIAWSNRRANALAARGAFRASSSSGWLLLRAPDIPVLTVRSSAWERQVEDDDPALSPALSP
jgi:hypothetical protein